MCIKIAISLLLICNICSQVFYEDFEQYYTGTVMSHVIFTDKWYRQDIDKYTGQFEIRNSPSEQTTTTLSLFVENSTTVTCIDITLQPSYIYQLSLDYKLVFGSSCNVTIFWNQKNFTQLVQDTMTHHFTQEVQTITSHNVLCLGGSSFFPDTALGPVVDNITIELIGPSGSASTAPQKKEDQEQVREGTVYSLISKGINSYTRLVRVMGFGYLINNLLNYWNLIVLYYFLDLKTIPKEQKAEFQRFCQISVEESSIFGFLSWISPFQMPEIHSKFQKVPKNEGQWKSYQQMGLSSNILKNNVQTYAMIVMCLIKMGFLGILKKILLAFQPCCISHKVINIKWKQILLYEVITETPNLIFPLSIMLSSNSSLTASTTHQFFNNFIVIAGFVLCMFAMTVNYLIKANKSMNRKFLMEKRKNINKELIGIEKKLKQPSIIFDKYSIQSNLPTFEKQVKRKELKKKVNEVKAFLIKNQFTKISAKVDLLDNVLFFTVPFLLGFDQKWVFFGTNMVILVYALAFLLYNNKIFRVFEKKEYYIRIFIKINWITYHLIHLLIYLHQKEQILMGKVAIFNLCIFSLFLILSGAIVESLNSIFDLIVWIFQTIKILCLRSNKVMAKNERFEQKISPIIPMKKEKLKINKAQTCQNTDLRISVQSIETKVNKSKKNITRFQNELLEIPKPNNQQKIKSNLELVYHKQKSNIFDIQHFTVEFSTEKWHEDQQSYKQ